jgi:hypothetical protein
MIFFWPKVKRFTNHPTPCPSPKREGSHIVDIEFFD